MTSSLTGTNAQERQQAVRAALNFHIPDEAWSDASEAVEAASAYPRSRLYTSLTLNGILFHGEALEVKQDEHGVLHTVDPVWDASLTDYYQACGAEGVMSTWTIAGRDYAVFFTPGC